MNFDLLIIKLIKLNKQQKEKLDNTHKFHFFQNLLAQSKAMEADLDNEIEKTKQEGTLYIHLQNYYKKKLTIHVGLEYRYLLTMSRQALSSYHQEP